MVDYINIRGHEGKNITVPFWQPQGQVFHTDSSFKPCTFDAKEGSVENEDNFGLYVSTNVKFKCTESDNSTTQFWLGTNV